MNIEQVQQTFRLAISESIELLPEGTDRYQVFTPFQFGDGDHFVIVMKKNTSGEWVLTDEGHTYMHISYDMDMSLLSRGNRNEIIEGALDRNGIVEQSGQLVAPIESPGYAGNILYNFIQCLIHISDISYLSKESIISTFIDDFKSFVGDVISPDRYEFDYHNLQHDSAGKYLVDCRVNGMAQPMNIYAIGSDDKCRDATIGILQFEKWGDPFLALGIFEDQEQISRKVLARFTDVCDRQFSSLATSKDRIRDFILERVR